MISIKDWPLSAMRAFLAENIRSKRRCSFDIGKQQNVVLRVQGMEQVPQQVTRRGIDGRHALQIKNDEIKSLEGLNNSMQDDFHGAKDEMAL